MLSQTQLPFQYEIDPTNSKLTALGGLPLFLDLMAGLGVIKGLRQCLVGPGDMQGWSVSDVVLALVMVNLAGGECVDDLDRLNADVGFAKVMELAHKSGYSRQQLRALKRKLAKLGLRKLPSKSSAFRSLEKFHDPEEEKEKERRRQEAEKTGKGKAYVQKPNELLRGLMEVQKQLVAAVQRRAVQREATLGPGCHVGRDAQGRGSALLQGVQGVSATEHVLGQAGVGPAYGVQGWQRACGVRAVEGIA